MYVQESSQDYLEAIYMLSQELESVRAIDVARMLGVSKPSVSVALKQLKERGCLEEGRGALKLTAAGLAIATDVYEKHELLRNCFISIGVSEATARKDACRIEHVLSPETTECLKKHLLRTDREK